MKAELQTIREVHLRALIVIRGIRTHWSRHGHWPSSGLKSLFPASESVARLDG